MLNPTHTINDVTANIKKVITNPQLQAAALRFFEIPIIKNGFTTAPASGKVAYHHAYRGGLLDHSLDVFHRAVGLNAGTSLASPADLLLAALLHDIHKIGDPFGENYYKPNILKSGAQSDKVPYEHNDAYCTKRASVLPPAQTVEARALQYFTDRAKDALSGGDLSLELVYAYAPDLFELLTDDIKFAIRYHDGAYVTSRFNSDFAGKETPLQIIIHAADMLSSRLATGHGT